MSPAEFCYRLGSQSVPFYWLFLIPLARYAVLFDQKIDENLSFEIYLLVLIAFCTPRRPFLAAATLACLATACHFYLFNNLPYRCHYFAAFTFASLFHAFGLAELARKFRQSFTCVENVLVIQLATLALYASLATLTNYANRNFCEDLSQIRQIEIVLSLLCIAAILTLVVCLLRGDKDAPTPFLVKTCAIVGSVGVGFIIYQQSALSCSVIEWTSNFFTQRDRLQLMQWWMGVLAASILLPFVLVPAISNVSTSTRRKFFHAAILAVLWPGIIYNANLTRLAAGGTLFLLIISELLKMHRVYPFTRLDELWRSFTDSKDCGPITLSHIYLLLGCSMPLLISDGWIGKSPRLSAYSGLLSVAIGDACAAIVGKSFGRNFWPGPNNRRTLEGSLGFVVSQVIFIAILQFTSSVDLLGYSAGLNFRIIATFIFSIPLALVATVEANCKHFDNIVLPALTFIFFKFMEFFIR